MEKTIYVTLVFILAMLFLAIPSIVYAQWSALSSGYAITTNWHGQEVPFGENVTAWAGTTDNNVEEVVFQWKRPDESIFIEVTVSIFGPYTTPNVPDGVPQEIIDWAEENQNIDVYYANNTQVPDTLGDWGIQALFIGEGGTQKANHKDVIKIRSTSTNVISDLPLVGTAGALVSMLLGFGLSYKKRKTDL